MKADTRVIFQGEKAYLKAKLAVTVVEHLDCEVTEVIMHDASLGTEAPRIYFSSPALFSQLKMDDIEEQLSVANQNGLTINDKFVDGVVSKSKSEFILSRLSITTYSVESKKVCITFQMSDVNCVGGALLCEKPASLREFQVPTGIGVGHSTKAPVRPALKRAKARRGSLLTRLRQSFQLSPTSDGDQYDAADAGGAGATTRTAEQSVVRRLIASFVSVSSKAENQHASAPPQPVQIVGADCSLPACTADNSHTDAFLGQGDLSQQAATCTEHDITTKTADVSVVSAKKPTAHRKRSFVSSFLGSSSSSSKATPPSSTKYSERDAINDDKVNALQRFMSVLTNWRSSNKIYVDSAQDV